MRNYMFFFFRLAELLFCLATLDNHDQYTQTDTNRQETLTNGTIGKKSPFVKEALRFGPLVRMEISSQAIGAPFLNFIINT